MSLRDVLSKFEAVRAKREEIFDPVNPDYRENIEYVSGRIRQGSTSVEIDKYTNMIKELSELHGEKLYVRSYEGFYGEPLSTGMIYEDIYIDMVMFRAGENVPTLEYEKEIFTFIG